MFNRKPKAYRAADNVVALLEECYPHKWTSKKQHADLAINLSKINSQIKRGKITEEDVTSYVEENTDEKYQKAFKDYYTRYTADHGHDEIDPKVGQTFMLKTILVMMIGALILRACIGENKKDISDPKIEQKEADPAPSTEDQEKKETPPKQLMAYRM